MIDSMDRLRRDALAIWQAGVDAVRSDRLVQQAVRVADGRLVVADQSLALDRIGRIAVVGCGKAGAGMAAGLEAALGPSVMAAKQVCGWINVPDDCVRQLTRIHLHAARPAGVNEPTQAGLAGAQRILDLVGGLSAADLCLCLISGGGSALLPAPVEAISLEDKLAVTRHLSSAGANIQQLNTVRKQLSRIKGGGLARACRAGRLITLIISDVLGDPLDVIASGPTVPDRSTPQQALAVLEEFGGRQAGISEAVFQYLQQATLRQTLADQATMPESIHRIIGNNALAVAAAAREARRLGYEVESDAATQLEGHAEAVGFRLADAALELRRQGGRRCLITGGEPTVQLVPSDRRGQGGRNQQLVLAAFERLIERGDAAPLKGLTLLSGGTDGEDGPTDAAGAWIDDGTLLQMRRIGIAPRPFLERNDAYHFFDPLGALLRTGPTDTNVCDLRVVVSRT